MSNSQNTITVLYFAAAATITGRNEEVVAIPSEGVTLEPGFKDLLTRMYGGAKLGQATLRDILDKSQWSVDAEMVENAETVMLKGGEEVAVICPVSGG